MKKYNKVVRDKIPELIENNNKRAIVRVLDNKEYLLELTKKLEEETAEYVESEDIEELVDIMEVIFAILDAKNISFREFDKIRLDKIVKNGSFYNKTFLEEVVPKNKDDFYKGFTEIIKKCKYSNTYKFAWAKSLVELASENEYPTGEIDLMDIAEKFIKYYWNLHLKNDFKQGTRNPKIVLFVKDLMGDYSNNYELDKFENVQDILNQEFEVKYEKCLEKTVVILKKDVSWRFRHLSNYDYCNLYHYYQGDDKLIMNIDNLDVLRENKDYLIDLIEYKWGLVLDKFAGESVEVVLDDNNFKLGLLKKYKSYF